MLKTKGNIALTLIIVLVLLFLFSICCRPDEAYHSVEDTEIETDSTSEVSIEPEIVPLSETEIYNLRRDSVIVAVMHEMTIQQKIGQLFMVNIRNDQDYLSRLFNEYYLGGIIVFSSNIQSAPQVQDLTNRLQQLSLGNNSRIGLLIAVDQEGGIVARLKPTLCPIFPSNQIRGNDYAVSLDVTPVETQALETAHAMNNLGLNMNLAPVLDVRSQANSVVGSRSYSSDENIVAQLGVEYITTLQGENIIATTKHFPGHGPTVTDSHHALPFVRESYSDSLAIHLYPFKMAIDNGVSAVMTAHVVYESLDDKPATFSNEIINNLLRDEMGFEGVVITDDICMGALQNNYGIDQIVVEAINAGVDIILICDNENYLEDAYNAIITGLAYRRITMDQLNLAVYRILKLKYDYELIY